jgi:hypothetical protein
MTTRERRSQVCGYIQRADPVAAQAVVKESSMSRRCRRKVVTMVKMRSTN